MRGIPAIATCTIKRPSHVEFMIYPISLSYRLFSQSILTRGKWTISCMFATLSGCLLILFLLCCIPPLEPSDSIFPCNSLFTRTIRITISCSTVTKSSGTFHEWTKELTSLPDFSPIDRYSSKSAWSHIPTICNPGPRLTCGGSPAI